jgi:cold shock protein
MLPYRLLALRVIDLALRDACDSPSLTDRTTAYRFLQGSPLLTLWCALAELDPERVAAGARGRLSRVHGNGDHMKVINGTVKRLLFDKGFGFVAAEDGNEYFFHRSACAEYDSMREGQAVTFQTGQGPKGPRAENVRLVQDR